MTKKIATYMGQGIQELRSKTRGRHPLKNLK